MKSLNSKTIKVLTITACLGLYISTAHSSEYPDVKIGPKFNDKGQLIQPKDFRQWVFIGAPLTPNGLNNGKAGFPEFHNVYVEPAAFEHYRKTGVWPEGTMMVKELHLTEKGQLSDGSRVEPSGRGYFPGGGPSGLDVSVKDSKRFAKTKNWGFFNFGHHAPPFAAVSTEAPKEACAGCHIDNAQEDMVYVQFYKPILDPLPLPKQ
ncbi:MULTISPECIES: cytochrome P460 family protein [Pseudomonas]|uniref:cytochrome P460 family protein n=1 Tax=Pseudomonas TaxID=286 RepID=UPI002DB780D2|nr:cytochrome P460 family protein [Pseudomonas asiatica]MEB6587988.1 cytochrome P460 family protein [Pseudomonas asiatica]